uniref:Uncharacterized protein n=1 Tax=Rhizophora mucronata TaxID=61149 RepID=A0A2P2N5W8_RHIMU
MFCCNDDGNCYSCKDCYLYLCDPWLNSRKSEIWVTLLIYLQSRSLVMGQTMLLSSSLVYVMASTRVRLFPSVFSK